MQEISFEFDLKCSFDLDDGGADITGTKGAESGFVGEEVDAEEEAVEREWEGLGMCTFTPLLRVVEKPCIDADDEVFSRRRLKQKQSRRKRAERTRTRRTPRTAPSTAQLVSPSVGWEAGLLDPSSPPFTETSTRLLTRPLMPPSP